MYVPKGIVFCLPYGIGMPVTWMAKKMMTTFLKWWDENRVLVLHFLGKVNEVVTSNMNDKREENVLGMKK